MDLFEQIPDDWRMSNHLRWTTVTVKSIGNFDMYILYKFQGNPALRQNDISWNYQNKPKVFRIAEMYLIRAEALAKGGAPQAGASDPWADLYTLRSARATNYQPNQNGESIEDAILNEERASASRTSSASDAVSPGLTRRYAMRSISLTPIRTSRYLRKTAGLFSPFLRPR